MWFWIVLLFSFELAYLLSNGWFFNGVFISTPRVVGTSQATTTLYYDACQKTSHNPASILARHLFLLIYWLKENRGIFFNTIISLFLYIHHRITFIQLLGGATTSWWYITEKWCAQWYFWKIFCVCARRIMTLKSSYAVGLVFRLFSW